MPRILLSGWKKEREGEREAETGTDEREREREGGGGGWSILSGRVWRPPKMWSEFFAAKKKALDKGLVISQLRNHHD